MNITKNIFTYFLILVYGVSFGHQIIPHHHHVEMHEEIHDHCAADIATHDHISHEQHFDEGLIDYLGCLLANHKHSPINECQFLVTEKNERFLNEIVGVDEITLSNVVQISPAKRIQKTFARIIWVYQNPISQNRALRGPPFNMA